MPLPPGKDPADLVQAEGADRLRERVELSVPFVEFHVERILERADATTAEGKDRAIAELAPALKLDAYAGTLREELPRRISGRLELSQGQLAELLRTAEYRRGAPGPRPPAQADTIDPAMRTERAFLVLCIALPQAARARSDRSRAPSDQRAVAAGRPAPRRADGRCRCPGSRRTTRTSPT